jgi:hypothetical protein
MHGLALLCVLLVALPAAHVGVASPVNLTVVSTTGSSITVSWVNPVNYTNVTVWFNSGGCSYLTPVSAGPQTVAQKTYYTLQGLEALTTYCIVVQGWVGPESTASTSPVFQTTGTPVQPPSNNTTLSASSFPNIPWTALLAVVPIGVGLVLLAYAVGRSQT